MFTKTVMNNYLKLNKDLINIVRSYTLPSLGNVRKNVEINKSNLNWETRTIHIRLEKQDCFDSKDLYYKNLKNTRIMKCLNNIGNSYWTIEKN